MLVTMGPQAAPNPGPALQALIDRMATHKKPNRERKRAEPVAKPTKLKPAELKQAKERARATYGKLREIHPDAHCELDHQGSFQLLVATVLSAQTTDVLVNKVTPHLFARYPDSRSLAAADPAAVGALLRERGLGMYNQKAKNIVGLARGLVEKHGGEVPRTLAELIELPGVGRKTANVVLGVAFGAPEGVVVDTHVQRLSQRLGWTKHTEPPEIEKDLCALFPREDWDMLSHTLIFHGRRVCFAQRPACAACGVSDACPSAFRAETIGRKPPRKRA
jgi:endonuclease-3